MALMTQAQITAELQRKKNAGETPTDATNNAAYSKLVQQKPASTPNTNTGVGAGVGGAVPGGLTSSGGGWFAAIDALKNSQTTTPGAAIGAGVGAPTTPYIPPADTNSNNNTGNNVGTAPPTGMIQAMKELPTYVPPTTTGLNFADATNQVKGQIDPMFQRALEALQAQKHQDQLNGDQLGMARGGSHSGLAADLQNKVAIASAGKASDLDATRQTQTAQMAQDLVNRGEDNDYKAKQQALAEYLGINQLNLQQQGQQADYTGQYNGQQTMQSQNQNFQQGVQQADLTGIYKGMQTLQAQNQGFNQNLATNQYNQGVKNDTFNQNLQTKQLERGNFESDRSYNLAKSTQEWTQTFQKEQYTDQKAQQLWDNTFKDKSFIQSVSDAAASRGLQWAGLNQRDKEYIADSAFREKSFNADQEQRKIDNLKSGGSDALNKEIDGLYTGLTSGQLTGSAAIEEIDGRVRAGILSKTDADKMKSVITTVTSSQPNVRPPLTQDQIDSNGGNNPQDLNSAQLDKLWKTDPTGQAAGRPSLDWASWYTDPRGRVGGISFESWRSAYGPQIKG